MGLRAARRRRQDADPAPPARRAAGEPAADARGAGPRGRREVALGRACADAGEGRAGERGAVAGVRGGAVCLARATGRRMNRPGDEVGGERLFNGKN